MNVEQIKYAPMRSGVINIIGNTYGKLTVLGYAGKSNWYCECICGNFKKVRTGHLTGGATKSCGCNRGDSHGMSKTTEHNIWCNIKQRCYNPNVNNYHNYGGRGITMCDEWKNSFLAFYRDMGNRPDNLTLEREDNDGDYCKENCKWATRTEQNRNRRNTIFVNYNNSKISLPRYCELKGLSYKLITTRIFTHKWSLNKALNTPIKSFKYAEQS